MTKAFLNKRSWKPDAIRKRSLCTKKWRNYYFLRCFCRLNALASANISFCRSDDWLARKSSKFMLLLISILLFSLFSSVAMHSKDSSADRVDVLYSATKKPSSDQIRNKNSKYCTLIKLYSIPSDSILTLVWYSFTALVSMPPQNVSLDAGCHTHATWTTVTQLEY